MSVFYKFLISHIIQSFSDIHADEFYDIFYVGVLFSDLSYKSVGLSGMSDDLKGPSLDPGAVGRHIQELEDGRLYFPVYEPFSIPHVAGALSTYTTSQLSRALTVLRSFFGNLMIYMLPLLLTLRIYLYDLVSTMSSLITLSANARVIFSLPNYVICL